MDCFIDYFIDCFIACFIACFIDRFIDYFIDCLISTCTVTADCEIFMVRVWYFPLQMYMGSARGISAEVTTEATWTYKEIIVTNSLQNM